MKVTMIGLTTKSEQLKPGGRLLPPKQDDPEPLAILIVE